MPFTKRIVTPVQLSRRPVDKANQFDLEVISNNTLVSVIQQLASLAQHAEEIFADLATEYTTVLQKSQRLQNRVTNLSRIVVKCDAKKEEIPEGDLKSFAQTAEHHHADHAVDTSLFTRASRPDCVSLAYDALEANPVHTIRQCNMYRTDSKTGSKLFSLTPVLVDDGFHEEPYEVEFKPLLVSDLERKIKDVPEAQMRPKSMPMLEMCSQEKREEVAIPTPEDQQRELSRSQPIAMVPIDTSGSGFSRMSEHRQTLHQASREYVEEDSATLRRRKKKRRETVSGVPGMVFDELCNNFYNVKTDVLRTRSASRDRWERPWSMAQDQYITPRGGHLERSKSRDRDVRRDSCLTNDPEESSLSRSCSFRRSLRSLFKDKGSTSIDLWAKGRPESPGPPMVDLNMPPLRRSKSLPRSLKSVLKDSVSRLSCSRSASTEGQLDYREVEAECYVEHVHTKPPKGSGRKANKKKPSRLRLPRSQSHQTSLHSHATFQNFKERPRSMEVTPAQLLAAQRQPIPVSTPTMPSTESLLSTTDSQTRGGRRVHINIPDQPWTKPFATVLLRGCGKDLLGQQDRQSSSGHWSASTGSTRQSLETNSASSPERHSHGSTDKDSGVSLHTHPKQRLTLDVIDSARSLGHVDENGSALLEEDAASSSCNESMVNLKSNFTKLNSSDWLNSITKRRGKGMSRAEAGPSTRSISSEEGSVTLPSGCSMLTQQNLEAHNIVHSPLDEPCVHLEDEGSVYSIDQEGFYTSMHKDSGIRRSNGNLVDAMGEEGEVFSSSSTVNESSTSASDGKTDKKSKRPSSFLGRLGSLRRRNSSGSSKKPKKVPPPPPPRISTVLDKSNLTLNEMDSSDSILDQSGQSSELQRLASLAEQMAARKEKEARRLAKLERVHHQLQSRHSSGSTESETDSVVYARLKYKTNINTATIPALCSVTPFGSDEEDSDMLDYSSLFKTGGGMSYLTGSLKSTKSAPGVLEDELPTLIEMNQEASATSHSKTRVRDDSFTSLSEKDSDTSLGYSTWPRSPTNRTGDTGLKTPTKKTSKAEPPRSFKYAPKVNIFGSPCQSPEVNPRLAIPEAKTPDDVLDVRGQFSPNHNSFKETFDFSPSAIVDMEMMKFQSPTSLCVSPGVPTNYQHVMAALTPTAGLPSPADYHLVTGKTAPAPSQTLLATTHSNSSLTQKTRPCATTGTWPRTTKMAKSVSFGSSKEEGDVSQVEPTSSFPLVEEGMKTPPKVPCSLYLTSTTAGPQPAAAKLVISSPVANRACFVDNPYKRSMCSPVTPDDLLKFHSYNTEDKWYNTLPRKGMNRHHGPKSPVIHDDGETMESAVKVATLPKSLTMVDFPTAVVESDSSKTPSQPIYSDIGAMKHSVSFPVRAKDNINPSNYGRSWYDGLAGKQGEEAKAKKSDVRTMPPAPKVSFTSFLKDQSNELAVPFTFRRDSTASTISTNSSSSGKKSVTFASFPKSSMSSLNTIGTTSSSSSGEQSKSDVSGGLSLGVKGSSSGSSGSDNAILLQTILGSDTDDSSNTSSDSIPYHEVPPMAKILEPSTKRLKGMSQPRFTPQNNTQPSQLGRAKPATLISTSFVGPTSAPEEQKTSIAPTASTTTAKNVVMATSFVGPSVEPPESTNVNNMQEKPVGMTAVPGGGHARVVFPPKHVVEAARRKSESPDRPLLQAPSSSLKKPSSVQMVKTPTEGKIFIAANPKGTKSTSKSPRVKVNVQQTAVMQAVEGLSTEDSEPGTVVTARTGQIRTNSLGRVDRSSPQTVDPSSNKGIHSGVRRYSSGQHDYSPSRTVSNVGPAPANFRKAGQDASQDRNDLKPAAAVRISTKQPLISIAPSKVSSPLSLPPSSSTSSFSSFNQAGPIETKPAAPKFVLPTLRSWQPPAGKAVGSVRAGQPDSVGPAKAQVREAGMTEGAGAASAPSYECHKAAATSLHEHIASTPEGALPSGPTTSTTEAPPELPPKTRKQVPNSHPILQNHPSSQPAPQAVLVNGDIVSESEDTSSHSAKIRSCSFSSPRASTTTGSHARTADVSNQLGANLKPLQSKPLTRSSTSLNKWTNGLTSSSTDLALSSMSLAKSTDSLASTSSLSEKNRCVKLAFLNSNTDLSASRNSVEDRFAKHHRALSASRSSLFSSKTSLHEIREVQNTSNNNNNNKNISPSREMKLSVFQGDSTPSNSLDRPTKSSENRNLSSNSETNASMLSNRKAKKTSKVKESAGKNAKASSGSPKPNHKISIASPSQESTPKEKKKKSSSDKGGLLQGKETKKSSGSRPLTKSNDGPVSPPSSKTSSSAVQGKFVTNLISQLGLQGGKVQPAASDQTHSSKESAV